jgi:hypothetical protein
MSLKKNKDRKAPEIEESPETETEPGSEDKKSSNKTTKQDTGIRDAMDAIRAKFGEDSIMKLGEKPVIESVLSKSETKPRDLRQWVSGLKG